MMQAILDSLSLSSHHYLYASAYTLVPEFEPKHSLSSKQAIGNPKPSFITIPPVKNLRLPKNSRREEEIKFGGVYFWRTQGEIQKKVKKEISKAGGYNRKERLKERSFVLWPNSLEQLSS